MIAALEDLGEALLLRGLFLYEIKHGRGRPSSQKKPRGVTLGVTSHVKDRVAHFPPCSRKV